MRIRYDPEADAVYVYLRNKPYAYGKDLDDQRRIDYAADDTPIGIEILCVSKGVDVDEFPEQENVSTLLAKRHIKVFA